jgi:hypothetical protein
MIDLAMNISKTNFVAYTQCPKNLWLKLHKPELFEKFTLSSFEQHLMEQGNEVESCARNLKLFDGGTEVSSSGENACHDTARLMTEKVPTIFQATFIADGFLARNDMLSYDEFSESWNLYEVKGTNSLKEDESDRDHVNDVAFQTEILRRANVSIGRQFLIHLNREYVRDGKLNIESLFTVEDITDQVIERTQNVKTRMETASWYLNQKSEPTGGCECIYLGRKKHCTTFKYSHPHVPEYSVHDLSRISKKKLDALIESRIFDLSDIPDATELTDNQKNQLLAHKLQKPLIDIEKVRHELAVLEYPLYFLDYESYAPAIPLFDGFTSFQQIPFQFSLRTLRSENAELEHVEFLHEVASDPSMPLMQALKTAIGPTGNVIVWYKAFEGMINRQLATRHPEHAAFFEDVNTRLYDLMDIFQKQYYIHHGFKGSASIKKVLPTLLPELRYDELDIHEGGQASEAWWTMISPSTSIEESKKIAADLKTYCGLDTFAMYAIWMHLKETV